MFASRKLSAGVFVFLVAISVAYYSYLLSPVSASADSLIKAVTIGGGLSFKDIAALLNAKGIIRSEAGFKIYSVLSGSAHTLKSGRYFFSETMSTPEVVKRLVQGPPDIEVLIIEGKSLNDIDAKLARLGLIQSGEIKNFPIADLKEKYDFLAGSRIKTLEGFLFPDTYRFAPDSSPRVILEKMLDNFKDKAGGINFNDLIIASMIEREVPAASDRALVSGIVRKRLSIKMPLQVDATVIYAKCGGFDNCPPLTKEDFRIKSNYNTYYYQGLPPAPIANPGLEAIQASQHPETSSFLFYLSDPKTGKTLFSRTLEEHEC